MIAFSYDKFCISIWISLKFIYNDPTNKMSALVRVMAWRRTGDKPLHEPMMTQFTDAYMQHYGHMSGNWWVSQSDMWWKIVIYIQKYFADDIFKYILWAQYIYWLKIRQDVKQLIGSSLFTISLTNQSRGNGNATYAFVTDCAKIMASGVSSDENCVKSAFPFLWKPIAYLQSAYWRLNKGPNNLPCYDVSWYNFQVSSVITDCRRPMRVFLGMSGSRPCAAPALTWLSKSSAYGTSPVCSASWSKASRSSNLSVTRAECIFHGLKWEETNSNGTVMASWMTSNMSAVYIKATKNSLKNQFISCGAKIWL